VAKAEKQYTWHNCTETGWQHSNPDGETTATNWATKASVGKCTNNTTINH
jgi:hypothetical protein